MNKTNFQYKCPNYFLKFTFPLSPKKFKLDLKIKFLSFHTHPQLTQCKFYPGVKNIYFYKLTNNMFTLFIGISICWKRLEVTALMVTSSLTPRESSGPGLSLIFLLLFISNIWLERYAQMIIFKFKITDKSK